MGFRVWGLGFWVFGLQYYSQVLGVLEVLEGSRASEVFRGVGTFGALGACRGFRVCQFRIRV